MTTKRIENIRKKQHALGIVTNKPRGHGFKPIAPGTRFSRLEVMSAANPVRRSDGRLSSYSLCKCDCGNEITVINKSLRMKRTQSCGCLGIESRKNANTTHGQSRRGLKSREYEIWAGMLSRVSNPKHKNYKNYGGRGITVCERWKSFENFILDMGQRPHGNLSLDRIDVNGNYEPQNCRWATCAQQANNTRCNRRIIIDGKSHTLAEWSKLSGVSIGTIHSRLARGIDATAAVFTTARGALPCPTK